MGVTFVDPAATLPLGGRWVLDVVVRDDAGRLVDDAPTVVVTRPDGTTSSPTVEHVDAGTYRAVYVTEAAGRHVAAVSSPTAGAGAAVAAYVVTATTAAGIPTASDVVAYMGPSSWTTQQIDEALAAELDAQRAVCRVGAYYGADLRAALLRRVQRHLVLRRLPLGMTTGDAGAGEASTMPPSRDPEVRRLEGPYRKVVIG